MVKNQDPVKLSTNLNVLRVDRAHLISQLGEFQVLGQVSAKNSDVHLHGQIGLELLEYFFHSAFEHTHGDAFVDLVVKGDLERPELKGWIDLRNALVQPLGLEHRLAVPVGRIDFTAERITLSNLSLMMDGAVAHASGWMALQKWVPGQVFGDVRGNLSPRLLQWFLKDHLAEAAGSIALDVHFAGTFSQPEWSGVADIRNVNARLRRWEHDLEIKSGNLHFSQSDILLGCPRTRSRAGLPHAVGQHRRSPDISSIDGLIGFRGGTLKAVDVMLNGSELPHRGEADTLAVSPHIRIYGTGEHLTAEGSVDLNEGRYFQVFRLEELILKPRTNERPPKPFWAGTPLLETMTLRLQAQSTGPLYIKSNVADLAISASLDIEGTLSDPRLGGSVQVAEGGTFTALIFRIPFVSNSGK